MIGEAVSDADLVGAFLASRREAEFRFLYRRHTPRLWRVGRRLGGGDRAAVEDVVQETWLRAVRALPGFQFRSSLASWLTGILLNVIRERWRSPQAREVADDEADRAGPAPTPEIALALDQALAALPEGARLVLVLHDIGGLTHAEIAAALGIDETASKTRLSRARASVRGFLADPSGDPT